MLKYTILQSFDKNSNAITSRLIFSSNYLYQQDLALASIYDYLSENSTTTIKNQPIQSQMDSSLRNISSIEKFYYYFQNQQLLDSGELDFLLTGNICTIIPPDSIEDCISLNGGPGQNGIVGLNSFVFESLSVIKNLYNTSNQSKEAIIEILSVKNLISLENIFERFSMVAYNNLFDFLIKDFHLLKADLDNKAIIWIAMSCCCCAIAIILIWYPSQKKIMNETNLIKRVLILLPRNCILDNVILKKFIWETSQNTLNLFKL